MKNLAILALLALCPLSQAQTKPDIQLPPNVRMYEPKNLTPDKAPRLANSVRTLLNGVSPYWDDVLHAFVLRGNPQEMDLQEALLKRYDVVEPRVELTVYLIRAATAPPASDPRLQVAPLTPVPPELKSAIDEMKGAFKYDHYSLWDTIVVPLKGDGGEVKGLLAPEVGAIRSYYSIHYNFFSRSPASDAATFNLTGFVFSLRTQPSKDDTESRIETAIGIHQNEKLVLGKIHLLPGSNADLFLVLTAKIQ
jgi:hypothetical protein